MRRSISVSQNHSETEEPVDGSWRRGRFRTGPSGFRKRTGTDHRSGKKAGYEPEKDICIAIDAAASELYDEERGIYVFPGEGQMKGEEVLRDSGR